MKSFVVADLIAIAGALIWATLLVSEAVAENMLIGLLVLFVTYVVTCAALVAHARRGGDFSVAAQAICMVPAALLAFTIFGLIVSNLPVTLIPSNYPELAKFFGFLIPGLVSTAVLVIILALPTALLFNKMNWLVPVLALVMWFLVNGDWLTSHDRTLADSIILFEIACLGLVAPLALTKGGSKIRRRIERAA